ncbi:MerR family transcriptional regulator [Priestia aryabhattai]|uniref:MerR family transcriptional regulator n=1 Tax=Priestia megaterium TaxID=1404 RepID=UPI0039B99D63
MNEFNFFEELEFLTKLKVGIGETSEITGIPQRQLRYWENKGIISSLPHEKGNVRRYDYTTIKKILLIKEQLDEGYTLEGAIKKVNKRIEYVEEMFEKIKEKENQDDNQFM